MVECHPGSCAIAKSRLTTLCTETTSGVASAARRTHAPRCRRHSTLEPRQPSANTPYAILAGRERIESRAVARSGTRPTYQKISDTVRYVVTAAMSHGSALLKFGHTPIVAGYGMSQ